MTGAQVIEALEQQLACYQRLARLAEAQRDHVQQGDAEALLGVLRRRQGVLDELARLESVVGPAKRQWTDFAASLPVDRRSHAESVVAESRSLLERITRSDQEDVMLLQQRKLNVGREMGQAAATRQVNRAYAAAAYGGKRSTRMDVSQ
jgi:hypothetical protein